MTPSEHTNFYIDLLEQNKISYFIIPNLQGVWFEYDQQKHFIYSSSVSINNAASNRLFRDKSATAIYCNFLGIKTPNESLVTSKERLNKFISNSKVNKFILKPKKGSLGKGLYIFEKDEEIPVLPDMEYIIQEYVDGYEYRVLKVDDRVINVKYIEPWIVEGNGKDSLIELAKSTHQGRSEESLNNIIKQIKDDGAEDLILPLGEKLKLSRTTTFAQGSTWHHVDLGSISKDALEILQFIASKLDIRFAGLDIIFSKSIENWDKSSDDYYLLEINTAPHLKHYTRIEPDPKGFGSNLLKELFSKSR